MKDNMRAEAKKNLLWTLWAFLICTGATALLFLIPFLLLDTVTILGIFGIVTAASSLLLLGLFLVKLVVFFISPEAELTLSIAAKGLFFVVLAILLVVFFGFLPDKAIMGYDNELYLRMAQYQANVLFPIDYNYSRNVTVHEEEREEWVVSSRELEWDTTDIIRVKGITPPDSELGYTMSTKQHKLEILPAAQQSIKGLYYANRTAYGLLRALPVLLFCGFVFIQVCRMRRIWAMVKVPPEAYVARFKEEEELDW